MQLFKYKKHREMWKFLSTKALDIIKDYNQEIRRSLPYCFEWSAATSVLNIWKAKWIDNDEDVLNNCYACDYAYAITNNENYCKFCPFDSQFSCDAEGSPYVQLINAIIDRDEEGISAWCDYIANYSIKDEIVFE